MGAPYQMVVSEQENVRKIALMDGKKLLEYHQENVDMDNVVGSIFLGRVERVLPDVKAAFVRIGLKQNGFLPLKEAESYHKTCGSSPLMSGQEILVQVKKAPKGGKGAFLTRDIALPGQYVLLMPCNRFIGLSKRVEDPSDRKRALQLGEQLAQGRFGLIVRHAALFSSAEEVRGEVEELWRVWQDVSQTASCRKAPAVMHQESSMQDVLLRDYSARHEIAVSSEPEAWQKASIDGQLKAALNRRVELPGGGSLVIDEREALQTIDVNSGSAVKAENGLSLAAEENLRAVPEIVRQIRLRNMSGIILIDFIDMESEQERTMVQTALEEALRDDRVKNVVHGFTRLGLMEMTRKRTGDSLRDMLTEPCSKCCETGRVMHG